MARPKKVINTKKSIASIAKRGEDKSLFDKLQSDINQNLNFSGDKQSYLNLVLGGLIVLVIGALLFNYFNKQSGDLGPSQQANNQEQKVNEDVKKENLPGKYTVKEGDTLFSIAQNYYNDGYKYPEILKTNKLENENLIAVGQVLEIPKVASIAVASPTPSTAVSTESAQASPSVSPAADQNSDKGTGGAENQTAWGEKITSDTYTVQPGDWLSTISGRAYGDILQFERIAKANNIANPDLIEVGTVLKIPR